MSVDTSYNIWSVNPLSSSSIYPYITGVQSGLKLTFYFDYSTECISNTVDTVDDVYYLHENATESGYSFEQISFNVSEIIGNDLSASIYYCYMFE